MSDLTVQQRAAVNLRETSVVLASGAGCGKTQVLTERYVSHLMKDSALVGQIVAITFTDRAAREMRERIRNKIANLPDSKGHFRDLETAQIATIHSFCGNLLRQFAVPAGLDPGFEVLDDIMSTNLRADATTNCLHGLLEGKGEAAAARALRELVVLYGYPAVVEAIDSFLLEVDRPVWERWLARPPTEIAAEWTGPVRRELLPMWVGYVCAASSKIARGLRALEGINSASRVVMEKVHRLLDEVPRLHESSDLDAKVEELCSVAMVKDLKKADKPNEETYEALKEAFEAIRGGLKTQFDFFADSGEGVEKAAHVGQQFLRVALAVDDEYRRRKSFAAALDFQDLLTLARDILRDQAEVREATRRRYRFLLLDELQDTDPVQMELVELICGEGLKHGKLFAVGDHKQSIYRFRGAEVGLFTKLQQTVASEGRLELSKNFRSQPGILEFVNSLFERRLAKYEPLEPQRKPVGEYANVEFRWSLGEGPVDDLRRAEADVIARRIAELLADPTPRLLGKEMDDPPRPVKLGDVTLLFRSMTHVATYEAALRKHGLDYYLVGGRAFFAQQEVYDLLNLLRAVENPQDSASLVGALRSPFFNLSDESVFLLAIHDDGVWAGLHDRERLAKLPEGQRPAAERAARWLAAWRDEKDRIPIARLLNRILADSGYDAALQFEFLGDRKLANLWKLIDLARSFDRTGLFGLHELTARLGDLVAREPREEQAATVPESADVVKLMSIHQAKGLEFPVVFVPDFAAQRQGGRDPVARWHRQLGCLVKVPAEFEGQPESEHPFSSFANTLGRTADQLADWQEDLRVLYVACTRARDLLVLSAGISEANDPLPANHWTLALEERFDIRTGRCTAAGVRSVDLPSVRAVTITDPDSRESTGKTSGEPKPKRESPTTIAELPRLMPTSFSLPALEASLRGEAVASLQPLFNSDNAADRSQWRSIRERLGPESSVDSVLWNVLDSWNFVEKSRWMELLAGALKEDRNSAIDNDLTPKLMRLADSPTRAVLAAAEELHRSIEFVADLSEVGNIFLPLKLHGVIDLLYRDSSGWHVLAIDRGDRVNEDFWHGRQSGLVVQAWVVSKRLGIWPQSVGLFDLHSARLVHTDPESIPLRATAEHFLQAVNNRLA